MTLLHQLKIQHLFWRAGFGTSYANLQRCSVQPLSALVRQLFVESEEIQNLAVIDDVQPLEIANKKEEKQQRKGEIKTLNTAWTTQMATTKAVLREKMTLFWHGHFATKTKNPAFAQQQNNTLRKYALGNFADLLMAVAKDAAMLQFLNNQQNRKKSPNENFARELMELFTLGRGNYTEKDVKEAARGLTGWGFDKDGKFVFRQPLHDEGTKTIFGETGNFGGEDVLRLILEKPKTAQFVCAKIYKFFVNQTVDERIVDIMAKRFYESRYDISDLMQYVLMSDWFYDERNRGAQIKSPVELLVGFQRSLSLNFTSRHALLFPQHVLGQVLFMPPNVAGWKGGKAWIDSSSLLTRMNLPRMIFSNETINLSVKDSGDENEEKIQSRQQLHADMNWENFAQQFDKTSDTDLAEILANFLLQVPIQPNTLAHLRNNSRSVTNRTEKIKQLTTAIMSIPEYQLS